MVPIPSKALLCSARGPVKCQIQRCTQMPPRPEAFRNPSLAMGPQLRGGRPNPIHPARSFMSSCKRGMERATTRKQESKPQGVNQSTNQIAEAREAALRAARLRRTAETETETELKRAEMKEYDKRYKTAARKWVSAMIALPILFVTSYYLFDRLALGNAQKTLPKAEHSHSST